MNSITAIIADDHATFRSALRKFVQTIHGVELVGEAADGVTALQLENKLRPQLVLMDICMPEMNGTDACREMKRVHATVTVVLYSANSLTIKSEVAQDAADLCLNKECLFDKLPAWISETFALSQRLIYYKGWQKFCHTISDGLTFGPPALSALCLVSNGELPFVESRDDDSTTWLAAAIIRSPWE